METEVEAEEVKGCGQVSSKWSCHILDPCVSVWEPLCSASLPSHCSKAYTEILMATLLIKTKYH